MPPPRRAVRPLRIMSIATALPTARVRRCVPPAPGITPRLISGWPNLRRLGGDDQVARHRELAAAAEAEARRPPRRAECAGVRIASQRSMPAPAVERDRRAGRQLADVRAGGERALVAAEHDAADRLVGVELAQSGDELVHQLARQRVQLLRPVEQDDGDRVVALVRGRAASEMLSPPPAPRRRASTSRASRARDSTVSCQDEVAPEVELLLRVARRLRQLAPRACSTQSSTAASSSRRGNGAIDEPPLLGLRRRNLLAQHDDLARAPVADEHRQPLRRAARRAPSRARARRGG